jgi:hypothetical protein
MNDTVKTFDKKIDNKKSLNIAKKKGKVAGL